MSTAELIKPDRRADRVVPPTGHTAWLTGLSAGALAFLAVFALALAFTTHRMAARWEAELAGTATIRISAPDTQIAAQTEAALRLLSETPGIADARALTDDEQRALLEPWLGADLPLDALPVPRLIEFREVPPGYDRDGLRLRLQGEVPGAVLDDHARWRRPLVLAAERLRTVGTLSVALIGGVMAALITLAAGSALAANEQVIRVLRLVGARDAYIARAFVRRFSLRALWGAAGGTLAGMAVVAVLSAGGATDGFLSAIGFRGTEWAAALAVPPLSAVVAFIATRAAAFRALRELR